MIGEYGGIGWATPGHEWLPGKCQHRSAGNYNTSGAGAAVLLGELGLIAAGKARGAQRVAGGLYSSLGC